MARKATPLTNTQVKQAKPKEKEYSLSDGDGLELRISKAGSKRWIFKYYSPTTSKRTNLSFGKYPEVSLAQAREQRRLTRELLVLNIDPKAQRDAQKAEAKQNSANTLESVAIEWLDKKRKQITADHATDILRSLEIHAFPVLGNVPVTDITAPRAIEALRPLEAQGKLETVKRVVQRLNEVMNYAVNTGLVHANPLIGIKVAFDRPVKTNNPHVAPEDLPELLMAIATSQTKLITKQLIIWQLHTMTRPNEASGTKWDEIDLENKVWTVPAERMKGREGKRKEHRIPLTPQMLNLLEAMTPISGHREYVFPSDRDPKRPANEQTANQALKRMGFAGRQTAHGLRGLASTTLHSEGFEHIVIEACLAHREKNSVSAAYNHSDYFERRKPVNHWWSDHLEQATNGLWAMNKTKGLKLA
ncbi:phage integrase [Vibrio astriarenae]|nr:phage integrase [Vibrio sp. C7]